MISGFRGLRGGFDLAPYGSSGGGCVLAEVSTPVWPYWFLGNLRILVSFCNQWTRLAGLALCREHPLPRDPSRMKAIYSNMLYSNNLQCNLQTTAI